MPKLSRTDSDEDKNESIPKVEKLKKNLFSPHKVRAKTVNNNSANTPKNKSAKSDGKTQHLSNYHNNAVHTKNTPLPRNTNQVFLAPTAGGPHQLARGAHLGAQA